MSRPSVMLGNITNGNWRVEFVLSYLECVKAKVIDSFYFNAGDLYLDVSRNKVVEHFLKKQTEEYLLFADSDIQYTPTDVVNLLSHANPARVVSGVYRSDFVHGRKPVAGRWGYHDSFKCDAIITIDESVLTDDVSDEGLVKVDGVGAGFMCFHRSLVERMVEAYGYPMPWFATMNIDGQAQGRGQQWYGEDYTFCLRAKALGVETYLVPEVDVTHWKMGPIRKPE